MANEPDRVYVALLRGINVGGKHKLPMADLAALCVAAGCSRVVTHIQSGNVAFAASPAVAAALPVALQAAIQARFGFAVPVVVRSATELAAVVQANPFVQPGADDQPLHVAFLARQPEPARVAALDPQRSPGDAFAVRGADVYLHLPNGVAGTRLSNAWLDAKLATTSTVRNWRTVRDLLALAEKLQAQG